MVKSNENKSQPKIETLTTKSVEEKSKAITEAPVEVPKPIGMEEAESKPIKKEENAENKGNKISPKKATPSKPGMEPKYDFGRFAVLSGMKPAHIAGFKSWAKRAKLSRLSMTEWRAALAKYWKHPVK